MAQFRKATKERAKARLALIGPSGSGKTYSALQIAQGLGERIAVIDSENESASKYADIFKFDTAQLTTFSPREYIATIRAAEEAGYDVIIIDSLSHAWMGKDGVLEMVDANARRNSGNSFAGWRDATPEHNRLVDALVRCKAHLIVTMRAKSEWVVEKDERTGKNVPRKIGLQPIQRDGLEYEFDVVADMDLDCNLVVSKTRCPAVQKAVVKLPTAEFGKIIKEWVNSGAEPSEKAEAPKAEPSDPEPAKFTGSSADIRTRLSEYVEAKGDGEPGAFLLSITGGKFSDVKALTEAQATILFNRNKKDIEAFEAAGKKAA